MSQMLHPGPETVSKGKGQLSHGKRTQACEAKAGVNAEVIMDTQGASSLLQRKEGGGAGPEKQLPGPRSELTHASCTQLCKGSGNPSECGTSVFPVRSIPLGLPAAKM